MQENLFQDDYNRYETTRHVIQRQRREDPDDGGVKFSGYGDRAGSGVELFPTKWQGGEVGDSYRDVCMYKGE